MPIEMIGTEIRDDRHVRTGRQPVQILQLKTAQLEHGPLFGCDLVDIRKQALADIAAQAARHAGGLQDRMRHRGGCRFAVAARHRQCPSRMELPEQRHLAGERHSVFTGPCQKRIRRRHGRIHHDQVGVDQVVLNVPAQAKCLDRTVGDLGQRIGQLVAIEHVGHGDPRAAGRQEPHHACATAKTPQPHDGDASAGQFNRGREIHAQGLSP